MTGLCLLSERPSSAIHLLYHAQTRGIKFTDTVIVGDGGEQYEILKDYAEINGFELHFVLGPNHEECERTLERISPDVLAIDTPSTILDANIISIPETGTINAHGAPLPEYRGYGSSHWAILYGDELGSSAHLVDENVDAGDILATRFVDIAEFDSIGAVDEAIYYRCKFQAMVDAISDLSTKSAELTSQDTDDGKQYFQMHETIRGITKEVLQNRGKD